MLRPILLALFIALTAVQPKCLAQDCQNLATTAQMRACENKRYENANRNLQAVYSQLMTSVSPDRKEKLRSAESAWVLFRDKNADFLASTAEGGTLAPLLRVSALAEMTEQRLQDLTRLARK